MSLIKRRPDGYVEQLGNGLCRRYDFVRDRWVYQIMIQAMAPLQAEFIEEDPIGITRLVRHQLANSIHELEQKLAGGAP